jgi:hypothetical protein
MHTILERRPSGLRLKYDVWLAASVDEVFNLTPHPGVTEVAVTRLILFDRGPLVVIEKQANAASNEHQTTHASEIRLGPHFPEPSQE